MINYKLFIEVIIMIYRLNVFNFHLPTNLSVFYNGWRKCNPLHVFMCQGVWSTSFGHDMLDMICSKL